VAAVREAVTSALTLLLLVLAVSTCLRVPAAGADAGPRPSGVTATAEAADATAHAPGGFVLHARSATDGGAPEAACPGKPTFTAGSASPRAAGHAPAASPFAAGWWSAPSRVPADRHATGRVDRAPPSPEPILLLCVLRI